MAEVIEIFDEEQQEEQEEGLSLLQSFFEDGYVNNQPVSIPLPNITHLIDSDTLDKVGQQVVDGYETDWDSMDEWKDFVEKGRDLVKQEKESRSTPWDGASNFKSPSLMNAALKGPRS